MEMLIYARDFIAVGFKQKKKQQTITHFTVKEALQESLIRITVMKEASLIPYRL